MFMKRSVIAFFSIVLFSAAVPSRAQVVPAATGTTFHVDAGGFGSSFQPDYAGTGVAYPSPKRLSGIGGYGDAHFSRWVQVEAEVRWSRFNQYCASSSECNGEDTYQIGPRIAPYTFHKITPYGKLLVGIGTGSFLTGGSFVLSYGGGADYRLTRRFTLRAFDFEFQEWPVSPTLHPYGGSVGLSYRILPWR